MDHFGEAVAAFWGWIGRSDWKQDYLDYLYEFRDFYSDFVGRGVAESLELLGKDAENAIQAVLTDGYLAGNADTEILRDFRKTCGMDLSQGQVAFLRELSRSHPSIYEVAECSPGENLVLKDAVRGGEPVRVFERSASRSLVKWELLLARVFTVKGVTIMSGGILKIPREVWPDLSATLSRLSNQFAKRADRSTLPVIDDEVADMIGWYASASWIAHYAKDRPQVVNMDGDAIEFVSLAFPIDGNVDAVAGALGNAEGFSQGGELQWSWLQESRGEPMIHADLTIEGERLLVKCNSPKRSERITARLNELLGSELGRPLRVDTSIEQEMRLPTKQVPSFMETLGPAEREALVLQMSQMLLDRYIRMLDDNVPMLGGAPRALVRTKAGRAGVINWLKLIETSQQHAEGALGETKIDFTVLWKELGLLNERT